MNLDASPICEIYIDESEDDVEFIGETFESANSYKALNSYRYVGQICATTQTIKLPTPFHDEELSKLFNVEMKTNIEEKEIEKECNDKANEIDQTCEKLFEKPCQELCVESPKESCENKQNEICTVIQNESLEKLYDKSSDELREESQHELAENQKKEIALNEVVNLAYRGNKHTHICGKNSERRDVLYKNFLRATRRFLWSIFEKEYDTTKYRYFKASDLYKTHVEEFYSKHFKRYVNTESNMNEERHKDICFALSIILTKNFSFPNKTTKQMKFANGLNKVCLRFALSEFKKVLAKEYIRDFFRVFKESGFLDLMLDTYPVLTKFKKMYYLVVDSIQDFECTQELMK